MNRRLAFASNVYLCLWLSLLLFACTSRFQEVKVTNVPVTVFKPGTQNVDVSVVLEDVTQRVHEMLPGAYFQGMVFSGKCQDLSRLHGKLVLVFVQVQAAIPKRQVVRASASVDTVRQTMDLHYEDVSDFYPSTKRRTLNGDRSIKEIAAIAHRHITELGLSDCDVTLTQLDDSWDVRCGPLNNFVQKCRFEIVSGEVKDIVK